MYLRILLGCCVPWMSALVGGRGRRKVVVVVLGIGLEFVRHDDGWEEVIGLG